jgi:hypothetical protein
MKHLKEKGAPGKPELFIVVTHDATHDSAFIPGVKQRDRNYTIETRIGGRYHPDSSGRHYVTMWEMQTGGNDRPKLADPSKRASLRLRTQFA